MASSKAVIFIYTGQEVVPKDVTIVHFSSAVTHLCYQAFWNCRKLLREVGLNEGLLTIGKNAFLRCILLNSITLPSTVTNIDDGAFMSCCELREVQLNKGLLTIGKGAFGNCTSLESLTFPCIFKRFDTISSVGQSEIEHKTNEIAGMSRRGDDLLISRNAMRRWDAYRVSISKISRLITYHELKEATTIIELSLWKSKMEEKRASSENRDLYGDGIPGPAKREKLNEEIASSENREACRVEVPGPVKDAILQYFSYNRG